MKLFKQTTLDEWNTPLASLKHALQNDIVSKYPQR
jgi:hypothetical protein